MARKRVVRKRKRRFFKRPVVPVSRYGRLKGGLSRAGVLAKSMAWKLGKAALLTGALGASHLAATGFGVRRGMEMANEASPVPMARPMGNIFEQSDASTNMDGFGSVLGKRSRANSVVSGGYTPFYTPNVSPRSSRSNSVSSEWNGGYERL